jgi:hypothetical protein
MVIVDLSARLFSSQKLSKKAPFIRLVGFPMEPHRLRLAVT